MTDRTIRARAAAIGRAVGVGLLVGVATGPTGCAPPPAPTTPPPRSAPASTTFANDWTVHAIDVGTGLSIFVEGPDFALLYDAGSNDDVATGASNRVVAYLRATHPTLTTIDHVVLSHPHQDHVLLLPDVFAAYAVRSVWDSGAVNPICGYRDFLAAVSTELGVAYHSARRGAGTDEVAFPELECGGHREPARTIAVGHAAQIEAGEVVPLGRGASMTFLHVDGREHRSDYNANSLVVRLDLGASRVLLMGDAEAGGRGDPSSAPSRTSPEGEVLALGREAVRADVLIVGHHGSKTSTRTAFLEAVAPRVAVISSGPHPYDSVVLPDAEVVSELTARARVLRTDVDDDACAASPAKFGPDHDRRPGGCDNVRVRLGSGASPAADYERGHD